MTIELTPSQERAIAEAAREGRIRSVAEFIETAIQALPGQASEFDRQRAMRAAARIRKIRKGVHLERGSQTIRELAHLGHKY